MSDCVPPTHVPFGLSVIVPVYNEAAAIGQTLDQIQTVLLHLDMPTEIIVVDDGSQDASAARVQQHATAALVVRSHTTNHGYGAALNTGVCAARYAMIAITDADGTYPIARLPDLVAPMPTCTMVVGARVGPRVSVPLVRRPVKWALRQLAQQQTGYAIPDLNSGLRVIWRAALLPLLPILPNHFSWTSTVTVALLMRQQTIRYVPIDYAPRVGVSKVHPIRDTLRATHCILKTASLCRARRVR